MRMRNVRNASALPGVACILVGFSLVYLEAHPFRISRVQLNSSNNLTIEHPVNTNSHFILYRSTSVSDVGQPANLRMGAEQTGQFSLPPSTDRTAIFRVGRMPIESLLDADSDGIDDVNELRRPTLLDTTEPVRPMP